MRVVVESLLSGERKARAVANGDAVCATLLEKLARLARMETSAGAETPEAVFARLGG